MTSKELGGKFLNKNEIDKMLVNEAGAYLPAQECCTIWCMKKQLCQQKVVVSLDNRSIRYFSLKSCDAKHYSCHQIDGLGLEEIIEGDNLKGLCWSKHCDYPTTLLMIVT